MNRQLGTRIVALVALVVACGFATTVSGQVFTGRVDLTVEDSSGGRAAWRHRGAHRPSRPDPGHRRAGAGALPEPAGRHLCDQGGAGGLQRLRQRHRAKWSAARPRAVSAKLGVAGTAETVIVTAATPVVDVRRTSDDDQRHDGRTAEHPERARSVGGDADRARPCYMDRVNVGGAESGQQSNYNAKGAQRQGQHVEHRRRAGHRHGRDRRVGLLLRLRQLPGDGDHDRRRRRAERDRRRAAEHDAAQGHRTSRMATRATTSRTRACRRSTSRRRSPQALGNTTGKGNRTDKLRRLRLRSRRADLQGPAWSSGARWRRTDHQPARPSPATSTRPIFKTWAFKVDGRVDEQASAATSPSTRTTRARTAGASARRVRPKPRGTRRGRPSLLQGRRQLRTSASKLFAPAKVAHVDGGFVLAPVGGLGTGLLHRRRRRGAQLVLPVPERPAAGLRRRRRAATSPASTR